MRIQRPPRPRTLFRLVMLSLSQLKWGVVAAVSLLIASMIAPGALLVLPQVRIGLCSTSKLGTHGPCSTLLTHMLHLVTTLFNPL